MAEENNGKLTRRQVLAGMGAEIETGVALPAAQAALQA